MPFPSPWRKSSARTLILSYLVEHSSGGLHRQLPGHGTPLRLDKEPNNEGNNTVTLENISLLPPIEKVGLQSVCDAIIAYEPVWAVGTGETATPDQAQQVHSYIRAELGDKGVDTQLLYGGSINADNAADLFTQPDIDGGLVGGASLEAEHFNNIVQQLIERK